MRKTVLFCLILLQCAATQTGLKPFQIRIYFPPDKPAFNYEILGTVAVTDEDYDDMIEKLQLKVIELQGTAAIIQKENTAGDATAFGTQEIAAGSSGDESSVVALVIRPGDN